jgi:hypothetical protein
MAAGEPLEPDVAERLDEQGRRGFGVTGGVAQVDRAAESELVADDVVAAIGDRLRRRTIEGEIASRSRSPLPRGVACGSRSRDATSRSPTSCERS